jgi:hypothetical protein
MPQLVTADTITDSQILALRDEFAKHEDPAFDFPCPGGRPSMWITMCEAALQPIQESWYYGGIMCNGQRYSARQELANLLNRILGF